MNEIDYDLIDEICEYLEVNEYFDVLNFEQRKEILKLHNEIISNRHKKEQNELIDRRNEHQFEMNGLIAMINSNLKEMNNSITNINSNLDEINEIIIDNSPFSL